MDSALVTVIFYNDKGNTITREEYDHSNNLITLKKYFYDEDSRIKKYISGNIKLATIYNIEYEYDSLGRLAYEYEYNRDTTRLTVNHKIYDPFSKRVSRLERRFNNNPFYTSRNYYDDEKGRLVTEKASDQMGKTMFTYHTEYNDKNRSKTVFLENAEGQRKESETFLNDKDQKIRYKYFLKHTEFVTRGYSKYPVGITATNYIYHDDGTLYERNIKENNRLTQLNRHFYLGDAK